MTTPTTAVLIAALAAATLACASARPTAVATDAAGAVRAASLEIDGDAIHRDATWLASDALRGRATVTRDMQVTPGLDSAAAFISRRLRALGVTPAGDNGTYLRHYTLRRAVLDTARTTASAGGQSLTYGTDFIVTSFNATGVHDAPVVYAGHGIRAPRHGIDPYAGIDVAGKWILVDETLPPGLTRAALGTLIADYTTVADEARWRGAVGIIAIDAQSFAQRAGFVPTVRDITPTAGRSYAPYPLPRITISATGLDKLVQGEDLSAADGPFRVDLAATTVTARPYNVMGIIPGGDPDLRDQYVSVAAHLDGAIGNSVLDGDSIYNAADDNASGSAGTLAIAEALMDAPRPKRSVLMIWDSGEEVGLWGSRSLAYSPLADSIVVHFNIDMIGRTNPAGTGATGDDALSGPGEVFITGPNELSPHLAGILDRIDSESDFIAFDHQFDVVGNQFFYPRTDASPFFERGIPFIGFFTGIHGDYHRPSDEPSKLDPEKLEAVSRAAFLTIWNVANDPVTPRIERPLPPRLRFITPRRP